MSRLICLVCAGGTLLFCSLAIAVDVVDYQFGDNGYKVIQADDASLTALRGVAVTADSILCTGRCTKNGGTDSFAFVSLTSDGKAVNAKELFDLDSQHYEYGDAVVSDANDNSYLMGRQDVGGGYVSLRVVKIKPDFKLDEQFLMTANAALDSQATHGSHFGRAGALSILNGQPGVLLAGYGSLDANIFNVEVARLQLSGNLDAAFNHTGFTSIPIGSSQIHAMALDSNNRIVICGSVQDPSNPNSHWGLCIRLTAAGRMDPTFCTAGIAVAKLEQNCVFQCVTTDPNDGSIYACGLYPDNQVVVIKYNPDGKKADGFGDHGILKPSIGNATESGGRGIVLSNGHLFIGATVTDPAPTRYAVLAVDPASGATFNGFGDQGIGYVPPFLNSTADYVMALALQESKLIAIGRSQIGPTTQGSACRILLP